MTDHTLSRVPEPGTVLVTGGAGFIGSHTTEQLLDRGYTVRVLDNFSNGKKDNLPLGRNGLELHVGDICDSDVVDTAMTDIDYCIHLAAQVSAPLSVEQPSDSAWKNIIGYINVLDTAMRHSVKKLVYASSAAVYGDPVEIPLTEHSPCCPINPYGLEKMIDEYYADLYARMHNFSSLGFRYFNVYGPRQDPNSPYSGVISKFFERVHKQAQPLIFGDGSQTRDFIHVYDVARANARALSSSFTGVCNVGNGESINLIELLSIIKDCTGFAEEPIFRPAREGDIKHSRANIKRLNEELDLYPIWTLDDGLKDLNASDYYTEIEAINY